MSKLQIIAFLGLFFFQTGTSSSDLEDLIYQGYKGQYIGKFQLQGSSHDIAGTVYVLNGTTLLVEGFQYDGLAPDAYFWAGSSAVPDNSGVIVPIDGFDVPIILGKYDKDDNGKYVILRLPSDISTYTYLSVWCQTFLANFAQINIPSNFPTPRSSTIDSSSITNGDRVSADAVYILNYRQIYFENLDYDGSCDEAYYWVGAGSVDSDGYKALDDSFRANKLQGSFTERDVTVTLPKPLSIANISYIAVWCQVTPSSGRSLGRVTIPSSGLNVPAYIEEPYLGKYLGFFNNFGSVAQNQHRVRGALFAIDDKTLLIKDFTFDGFALSTYVWGNAGDIVDPDGDILPVDGSIAPLGVYEHERIIVQLPPGKTLDQYGSISIYCRTAAASFGSLQIPGNFVPPAPYSLGELGHTPRAHNVHASVVKILDKRTFFLKDVSYDGNGPGTYFWVGVGDTPDHKGWKAFWYIDGEEEMEGHERSKREDDDYSEEPLPLPYDGRGFDGTVDIYVELPYWLTVFDIGYIGVWCIPFRADFAHLDISETSVLNIPSYGDIDVDVTGYFNCEVLKPQHFNVHWFINEDEQEIQITMEGRAEPGEYLAFGISGSESATNMIGSDVVVGWIEALHETGGFVEDYYLTSREQCVVTGESGRGTCRDERSSGTQDVELEYSSYYDGIVTLSYTRSLDTGDDIGDKVIPTDREVYISWAIGPIGDDGTVLKHRDVTGGNHRIHFGRPGSMCPPLEPGSGPDLVPWQQPEIYANTATVFKATIGQAGGRRGYEGLTGRAGWGITWYINDLIIPVITVKRGVTYTFEVYGGNDPALSASYHPFYITNDPIGGYSQTNRKKRQNIEIYAGPVEGPLCEWTTINAGQSPDFYDNFFDYRHETLELQCVSDGAPGILQWTPDANTPDTVYYQCYTHRYLGWKIQVMDEIPDCEADEFECDEIINERCIDISEVCDGHVDCGNLQDEENCAGCGDDQYQCTDIDDRRCIYNWEVCDGYNDCFVVEDESEDESDCGDPCARQPCQNGGLCFGTGGNEYFCSCPIAYGGINCETHIGTGCRSDEFECGVPLGRACIHESEVCDSIYDCGDDSDEAHCDCDDDEYKCQFPKRHRGPCIPLDFLCDGRPDCMDGEDENIQLHNCERPDCEKDKFTCDNGLCIPHYWVCDTANDCGDNSDEGTFCDGVCGVNPTTLTVSSGVPFTLNYQPALDHPSGVVSCLWTVNAPQGQRVYVQVVSFTSETDLTAAVLSFGPSAQNHADLSYISESVFLDLVSRGNTLVVYFEAQTPYNEDSFTLQLSATSNMDFQTCSSYSWLQVLEASQICDGVRHCMDGTDETELCPCPLAAPLVECTEDPCLDISQCAPYGPTATCEAYNCGECSAVYYEMSSGRRITDAECTATECAPGLFSCQQPDPNYYRCLPMYYVCDGEPDCLDAEDEDMEQHGCEHRECYDDEFTCDNGLCVSLDYVCDMWDDCRDNSDESDCEIECPIEFCTEEYNPQCGQDGVTYSNPCYFQQQVCDNTLLQLAYEGECQPECPIEFCTEEYNPQCGQDGVTYSNPCYFQQQVCDSPELELAYEGECQSECPIEFCTEEYNPQCGQDGVTYSNPCYFQQQVCNNPLLQLAYEGECQSDCPIDFCTEEYNPQCGHDGVTYSNPCYFQQQVCNNPLLQLAYEGECQSGPQLPSVTVSASLPLDEEFIPEYLILSSPEFQQKKAEFEEELYNFLLTIFGDALGEVVVNAIRQGSLIPDFTIVFNYPPGDISDPSTIQQQVTETLEPVLQSLIDSGALGSFAVLPGPVPPISVDVECESGYFTCGNQFCLPNSRVCDGSNDCGDASDEQNCYICPNGAPITTCPAGACSIFSCTGSASCALEFCESCHTVFYDSRGSPVVGCNDCPIACTRQWNPQCGSDGVTYGNPCGLAAAACNDQTLYLDHPGECTSIPYCESQPCLNGASCMGTATGFICQCQRGYTGNWCETLLDVCPLTSPTVSCFASPCSVGPVCPGSVRCNDVYCGGCTAIHFDGSGNPLPDCYNCPILACTLEWNPQCGSDGVTYGNPCALAAAACNDRTLTLDHLGECIDCPVEVCTLEWDPQCGSDGVTYDNPCHLSAAICNDETLYLDHVGECISIPYCESQPCLNGASCMGTATGFICQCRPGYTGTWCETLLGDVCPVASPRVTCFERPCSPFVSPTCPGSARCDDVYCGGCTPIFFDSNGSPLPDCNNCPILACTLEWNPQCGSDGVTYGNPCALAAAACNDRTLTLDHIGECIGICMSQPCQNGGSCIDFTTGYMCRCPAGYTGPQCEIQITGCTDEFGNPINNEERIPSSNPCQICSCYNGQNICAIVDCPPPPPGAELCLPRYEEGVCCPNFDQCFGGCPIEACTEEWDPQCGSDGVTYGNPCELATAACNDESLTLDHLGECIDCPIEVCTLEWDPQCGSDGVTYGNPCQLAAAACNDRTLTLDHLGECIVCTDEFGNPINNGQITPSSDPCETCSCYNGQNICAIVACEGPPPGTETCEPIYEEGVCCPNFDHCFVENPCLSYPCENGGVCGRLTNSYICQCHQEFTGPRCEIPVSGNLCDSYPCLNGGLCERLTTGYRCQCSSDFTGTRCETAISGPQLPSVIAFASLLLDELFIPEYLILASPEFQQKAAEIEQALYNFLLPIFGDALSEVDVYAIRQGSLIPDFRIVFNYPPGDTSDPSAIQQEVENLVQSVLQSLIDSGSLGSFSVVYGSVPPITVRVVCGPGYFTCGSQLCIPIIQVCNGNNDCGDASDEQQNCDRCPIEVCTEEYNPQCGQDGVTYSNPCYFQQQVCDRPELQLAHEGECQSGNPCDSRPCQNGGLCVQRANTLYICQCSIGYIGATCELTTPICSVVCDANEYDPQCGSDGTTYSSMCELERRATCFDQDLTLQYPGECKIGGCPPGVPAVRCFADPCEVNQCPNYPEAQCVASYCGGCFAFFYDEDGNPISECNGCPISICTQEHDPQCGSNGITYANPCHLSAAACFDQHLTLASVGECRSDCPFDACTNEYAPACGTNGVSYTNRCWLDVAACRDSSITLNYEGICRPPLPGCPIHFCTEEYNPQCGQDGVTYSNPCYFQQQVCDNPELELAYEGECQPGCPITDCPEDYNPQCATNGQTYSNLCQLNSAACYIPYLRHDYEGECGPAPRPWPATSIGLDGGNKFIVEIGYSGGLKGYTGITGYPSPGIAWYINGQLIPELIVQRGHYYIFQVSGGRDHSFYITNDAMGGFREQTREERQNVIIYSGPVDGPLCEWTPVAGTSPDGFSSFAAFSQTGLSKTCEEGEPTLLVWRPDEDTPDVLYYQSYEEKYVGWKIRVVDQLPRDSSPVIASTKILLLLMFVVAMAMQ